RCARKPSRAPRNIARAFRSERRRRALRLSLPRSGSRSRTGLWPRGFGPATALRACGSGHRPSDLGLERGDSRLQYVIFVARRGGHGLDRFELVAADEVGAAHPFLELFARARLGLSAHAGEGAGNAVHHLEEIVEQPVLGLHGGSPSAAEIGSWV